MIRTLRVRIKTQASASAHLKAEFWKASGEEREELALLRNRLQSEARAALLAYAYLRGRSRDTVERHYTQEADYREVIRLVRTHGILRRDGEHRTKTVSDLLAWLGHGSCKRVA